MNEELELLIEKMKEIPKQKKKLREQHILFGDDMSESEMKSLYKSIDQEEVETSNRISQIEKLITEIEETQIAGVDIERWMINLDQWLNSASTKEELNARQRYVLDQLNVRVVINKRHEDGSVEFSLETLLPSNMKNTFSEILKMKDYFQSQNNTSFPTIEQTWAYLSSSSSNSKFNSFSKHYTNGTQAEIKLNEINNKMKNFNNQYGLYFNTNNLMMNKSNKPIKLQAYCRNGDNKLSAKKTYKL